MNYPANSPITLIFRFPLRKFALSACLLTLSPSIYLHGQTTVYWDVNGTTAGAGGATPGGTWKTSGGANQNWGNAAGTAVTDNWTNGDIAVFSAGSDATGSFTVTLASAPTADSVVIEQGDITFASSTLTLIGSTPSIDVATGSSATFDSKLLGANGLVKDGGGLLVLNNTGNNYTGTTLVNAGTLQIGSGANILPTATDLVIAGGNVDFVSSASTHTVNSLSGAGSLDFGDNTFRVIGTSNTTFSGSISDSGGTFRKLGSGTLTLSGNNTFSGALDHNEGVIVVAHDNALGAASSGNDVASGAAL
ncbi:MAG: autotransporter-associated beta strand repeat-containing protein, partial [Verrucomicrobiales bacterium]|nr:autotransporter-associated beta strand repeat-containing protein [Verrucomicrobiales bacterium]